MLMTNIAVALFALTHAAAAHAQPARAYVTGLRGSDLNPCTRSEPCRQIRQGLSAAAPGGTLVVDGSSNFYTRVGIENCVIAGNDVGIRVKGAPSQPFKTGGVVRVAHSRNTQNTTGLVPESGLLPTYGNNRLAGNNTAGTFTGSIQQQ